MASRREDKNRRGDERNRVIVGLPERLRKSNAALKQAEKTLREVEQLYSQRLILKDSVVLDQIGERLNLPPLKGDRGIVGHVPKRDDGYTGVCPCGCGAYYEKGEPCSTV